MVYLTKENKKYINDFIANNQASNLPLVDLRARKTIKRDFNKIFNNEEDLVFYGYEGHYCSNAVYKMNNKFYILSYNFDDLVSYADYVQGYED